MGVAYGCGGWRGCLAGTGTDGSFHWNQSRWKTTTPGCIWYSFSSRRFTWDWSIAALDESRCFLGNVVRCGESGLDHTDREVRCGERIRDCVKTELE